ncbi:MAG: hypothetical protein ACW985_05745 [Candidatus Thorarchaeota archaeon]|jgi:hypothetical protein
MALNTWFHVTFDEYSIDIHLHPPGGEEQRGKIQWEAIVRVCFKPADFLGTDEILIFFEGQEESYLIPMEADGGLALWSEILDRGFFDAKLAIELASSSDEEFHCWPSTDEE